MKNCFLFCFGIIMLSAAPVFSQSKVDSSSITIYLYLGPAIAYNSHAAHGDDMPIYLVDAGGVLGLGFDFWGEDKDIIGLETYAVQSASQGYSDPKTLNVFTSFFYRKNITITKDITIFPQIGVAVFSNSLSYITTFNGDIGLSYNFNRIEIFIKNSFRYSLFWGNSTKWFFSTGVTFKF